MSAASAKKKLLSAVAAADKAELQVCLRDFAQELTAEISNSAPDRNEDVEEVLSALVAELALSAADQRRRNERQKHQLECIAAAKAKGVQFGRKRMPLPDDFDECARAWKAGELSIREAAESCGMEKSTFRRAILRREESLERSAQ